MKKIFNSIADLPANVRSRLGTGEQRTWLRVFNRTFRATGGSTERKESAAFRAANGVVRNMGKRVEFTKLVEIEKTDHEQRMVWGWAYLCKTADGAQVVDHGGDVVSMTEIQQAAEDFMLSSRIGGVMHKDQGGFVSQSIVVTDEIAKELGLTTQKRGWFIGFKVSNDDAWAKVKDGTFRAFSIGGTAVSEAIEHDAA